MTRQKTFKQRVRQRMEKTGESYTTARRMLIGKADGRPEPLDFEPPVPDVRLTEATGRGWDEWLRVLDDWGAADRTHTEIARWLREEQGVDGWYAQSVTLGYERARGRRAVGERSDGFAAGATRTVAVPVERLFQAFHEEQDAWLPAGGLSVRTATAPRSARYDWEDGSTRVIVGFESAGESKSRVALSHERLPDRDASDAMKAFWRARLDELKARLEAE